MLKKIPSVCENFRIAYKIGELRCHSTEENSESQESARLKEFRKKLQKTPPLGAQIPKAAKVEELQGTKKLRAKAPLEKLEELEEGKHPYQEKEPLQPFPDGVNPNTGEISGPKGPEPTRYGDWERKGRVSDF